jgi:hypothetical protein
MKSQEQQSAADSASSTGGSSWQFRYVMIVISAGVLILIGKMLGLF